VRVLGFEVLLAFLAGALFVAALWTAWLLRPGRKAPVTGPQQAAASLGALLDVVDELAWIKDAEGHFVFVNRQFGIVFKVEPAELVGKTDFDLSPPSVATQYREDDRRVMQSGVVSRREESVAQPGGLVGWAETVKVPLFDPQGRVVGTAGVARTRSSPREASPTPPV
jgi:PAS domain S-box-containing protein